MMNNIVNAINIESPIKIEGSPFVIIINYRKPSYKTIQAPRKKQIQKSFRVQQAPLLKRSDIPLQNDPLDLARLKKKRRVHKHQKMLPRLQDSLQRKQRELFNRYFHEQFKTTSKEFQEKFQVKGGSFSFDQLLHDEKGQVEKEECGKPNEESYKRNIKNILDTRILKTIVADRRIFSETVKIPEVVALSLEEYTRLQRERVQDVLKVVYPDSHRIDAYIDLGKDEEMMDEDNYSCMMSQFDTSADITPKSLFHYS